jgi:hypothetical protein
MMTIFNFLEIVHLGCAKSVMRHFTNCKHFRAGTTICTTNKFKLHIFCTPWGNCLLLSYLILFFVTNVFDPKNREVYVDIKQSSFHSRETAAMRERDIERDVDSAARCSVTISILVRSDAHFKSREAK